MTEPQKNWQPAFLYEPFDAANARIDTQEKVQAERWVRTGTPFGDD